MKCLLGILISFFCAISFAETQAAKEEVFFYVGDSGFKTPSSEEMKGGGKVLLKRILNKENNKITETYYQLNEKNKVDEKIVAYQWNQEKKVLEAEDKFQKIKYTVEVSGDAFAKNNYRYSQQMDMNGSKAFVEVSAKVETEKIVIDKGIKLKEEDSGYSLILNESYKKIDESEFNKERNQLK